MFTGNRNRKIVRRLLAAAATAILTGSIGAASASASGPAVFNRETYKFSTLLTMTLEANRYQVMVLQAMDAAQVPLLKLANPSLKVFMYSDPMDSKSDDPTGIGTCTDYTGDLANHPDWFLRDQNGSPIIYKFNTSNYVMDMGNPAYQQACLAHATANAKKYGFDGIFWDDIMSSYAWVFNTGITSPTYPTVAAWQAMTTSFLNYAGPAVRANGLVSVGNIAAASPALWAQWTAPLDGSEEESWTDGGSGLAQQIPFFANKLANAAWSEANHKLAILRSYNTTQAGNIYGLASMLLVANGYSSYSTANANYTTSEAWYPEYNVAQQLGSPTGAYTKLANGVYQRYFQNGVVLVNPTATASTAVSLGSGTYTGSGLTSVSSVAVPPTTGYILLNDGASTSPATTPPVNTGAPTISGTAVVGNVLTASAGTWTGSPAPAYTYQWARCLTSSTVTCVPISGATGSTYTVGPNDGTQYVAVTVTGTNSAGTAKATSVATSQVPAPTFALTASPSTQTIRHGYSAVYTIKVVPQNGFTGAVQLKVSGLGNGETATFSPSSTTGSSTLTVVTSRWSRGGSTLTVTGTAGTLTGKATVSLTVT